MENKTEQFLDFLNTNVFFKEFTFGTDLLILDENKQRIELADNIVCLEDFFTIYQAKERNQNDKSTSIENWFNNKVTKLAVKQIKRTVRELNSGRAIKLKNNRGHTRFLNKVSPEKIKKVVIYNPNESISENLRFTKFYESSEVGLIHLFHLEDYKWICQYLITPCEVYDYLCFREELYQSQKRYLPYLPEQYVLGHYLSGKDVYHIDPLYLENLSKLTDDVDSFDLGFYLSKFGDKIKQLSQNEDDYYYILCEIAKLHRNELREFKKRFIKCLKLCKENELYIPYRIMLPSTQCGFIFIPLPKSEASAWKSYLSAYTIAHKYDLRLNKCIGVVVYEEQNWFEIFWMYVDADWKYDRITEHAIKKLELRPTKTHNFSGYNLED